jgi:DNA-binding ferritin-like protein
MTMDLYKSNEPMIAKFANAADMATVAKQFGLANFLGDRQTAHQKWSWQLKAACSEMMAEEAMTEAEVEVPSPNITE